MNSVEPSGLLYSRLSCLDPESASKIMGFILIHGPKEAEMMSLATAPDAVLQQLISKGKNYSKALLSSSLQHSPTATTTKASPSYAAAVVNGSSSASSSVFQHADVEAEDGGCSPRSSFHKRSLSLSDAYGGGFDDLSPGVGLRPWEFDGFEQQVLRSRATQQQRLALASQIMAGASFPSNKYLSDSPRSRAAAMMMGEEAYKLAQFRNERSDLALMGCNAGSRQIYLTFPADSTFREEDVSNYFSIYGPVQDVRIPYQQKRMFGFVTFVHPETVKIILAKGNPHFVCDSRVLVKPYKEKGKVEKKQMLTQQQMERGDLSCLSPHGVDIRDFDVPIGPRMFYNSTQDLLTRRKLEEQAEFQQALEIQSRKMANLQLLDLENLSRCHPFSPSHQLSPAAALSSPAHHPLLSPNHMHSMGSFNQEAYEESNITPTLSLPPHALGNKQNSLDRYSNAYNCNEYITSNTNKIHKLANSAENESLELALPDTLDDTMPTRPAAPTHQSIFSSAMLAMNENAAKSPFSNSSTIGSCLSNLALPKSRFLDDPSLGAAGNQAIEM